MLSEPGENGMSGSGRGGSERGGSGRAEVDEAEVDGGKWTGRKRGKTIYETRKDFRNGLSCDYVNEKIRR